LGTGAVARQRCRSQLHFRERHDCWRIELDLEVIAEGVVDVTGYGASPVERAAFIVETIRDHLARTECTLHLNDLSTGERRLGRRPDWCPACGIDYGAGLILTAAELRCAG
jgi:hypothetical protein